MVSVRVLADGSEVDACLVRLPLTITHGRSSVTVQPDPPSTSITWDAPWCPWVVGDDLQVWSSVDYEPATYDDPDITYDAGNAVYDDDGTGEVWGCRFAGTVAGVEALSQIGYVQSWTVDAVGYLAQLGTKPITLSRGSERDVTRAQAICDAASVPLTIHGSPGVMLAAGDIDSDALGALHAVCESSGGLVWQDKDGRICYGAANHRPTTSDPVGVIPCTGIEDTLSWSQAVEDIVNEVKVTWGPADSQGESVHREDDSVAMPWGVRQTAVTTQCATESDAEQLGLLILARRAWPYYQNTSGIVAVSDLEPDDRRLINALDIGSVVLTPIPVEPGWNPIYPPTPSIVEGWIETWNAGEHIAEVAFSDQKRWVSTRLRNYGEVKDGGTYDYWRDGTYLDMLILEA